MPSPPLLALVCSLILGACQFSLAAEGRPNVLVILVDDLGYMDIGANNPGTFYETPNIDKLAATGTRFTDGYAANPVCSPTRYSIMTGRHPSRPDATNFFCGKRGGTFAPAPLKCEMPLDEFTLAQAMKAGGYKTFFAGKWHLGPSGEFWPENRGFDTNIGGHAAGGPWKGGQYFSPYGNPRLEDGPEGEYLTDRLTAETVKFIEASRDAPFFAYLSFYNVHTPLMAPEALVEKYQRKAERLGLNGKPEFAEEEQVWPERNSKKPAPRRVRIVQKHAVYAAMVEAMDTNVGRVLDTLDRLGVADNTTVVFTSDNGGLSTSEGSPTSNLPLRGGKGWIYEGGIREPFIIRWPGHTKPGSVNDTPVVSTDLYPTVLDIAGLDPRPEQHLDGLSLTPLLKGGNTLDRDALFWHYPHYSNQGGFPGGAVRVGDYKLVERYEDGRVHLYNLADDIGEKTDLAEAQPERVDTMRQRLHAFYKTVGAKFLQPKPGTQQIPWRPAP